MTDDFDQLQDNPNTANHRLEYQAEHQGQIEGRCQVECLIQVGSQDQDQGQDQEHPPSTIDIIYQLQPEISTYIKMMLLIPYLNKYAILTQWRIQDGAFGANAPPPPPPSGGASHTSTKLCQAKISS